MKKGIHLTLSNFGVILFYVIFVYFKWEFFYSFTYTVHLMTNLIAIGFTYAAAQAVWLNTFTKLRKQIIHVTTGISLLVALLWNIEHIALYKVSISLELYFIPIILSGLFFSLKTGFLLNVLASLSYALVRVYFQGFQFKFLFEGFVLFLALGLTVTLIDKVLNHRDEVANKHKLIVQESNSLIIGIDDNGIIDLCNLKMAKFLGLKREDILDKQFWQVEDRITDATVKELFKFLSQKETEEREIKLHKDNKAYTFILNSHSIQNDGFVSGRVIILTDITARKEMENKLEELATTDDLTGLFNRRYFERKFKEEIYRSERYSHPISIMLIDIDHFKKINDTYGHVFGDKVIKKVTNSILESVRKTDVAARIGGEEFVVLLPETGAEELLQVAERTLENIREIVFDIKGVSEKVTVSIGLKTKTDAFNIKQFMEEADQALYSAKENGRNQIKIA